MRDAILVKYQSDLSEFLSKPQTKKLLDRLERISCKIAPINTTTGNTQTIARWDLPKDNGNYAAPEECEKIFTVLIEDTLGFLGSAKYKSRKFLPIFGDKAPTKEIIASVLASSSRIGSLELPIEYKTPLNEGGKHVAENIFWYTPLESADALRTWVNAPLIATKIQVKAYLTDRRQTGEYQTNREIRWETYPNSPQFATKKDCIEIELKLLAQISTFVGAPDAPTELIPTIEKALGVKYKKDSFRCPISGKPIFYSEFYEKVASPVHGRSGYQVGHLNPLATSGSHNADNASWITDLGNRVQGDSSLEEITNDIFYMAQFHKDRLGLTWEKIEAIAKQKKS